MSSYNYCHNNNETAFRPQFMLNSFITVWLKNLIYFKAKEIFRMIKVSGHELLTQKRKLNSAAHCWRQLISDEGLHAVKFRFFLWRSDYTDVRLVDLFPHRTVRAILEYKDNEKQGYASPFHTGISQLSK